MGPVLTFEQYRLDLDELYSAMWSIAIEDLGDGTRLFKSRPGGADGLTKSFAGEESPSAADEESDDVSDGVAIAGVPVADVSVNGDVLRLSNLTWSSWHPVDVAAREALPTPTSTWRAMKAFAGALSQHGLVCRPLVLVWQPGARGVLDADA